MRICESCVDPGSLVSKVNPWIPVWILGLQYRFWFSSEDSDFSVGMVKWEFQVFSENLGLLVAKLWKSVDSYVEILCKYCENTAEKPFKSPLEIIWKYLGNPAEPSV